METRTEERVHFILKDDPDSVVYTYAVDCTDTMPDCAAANVDLMEQAIAWVEMRTVTEFFIGETRVVVETPWEVEKEGELNLPWAAHELRTLAQHGQAEALWHNPWSPSCVKRLSDEPSKPGALCYLCDFHSIRDYENRMERKAKS